MNTLYAAWIVSALVLIVIAILLGWTSKKVWYGILLDAYNKVSLSQLHTVLWTILILSLVIGVVIARATVSVDPVGFRIPDEVLTLVGITYGSTVLATAIKASKKLDRREAGQRSLKQLWTVDEGSGKDEDIDVTKFQNLVLIVIGVLAYIVTAVIEFNALESVSDVVALPTLDSSWVTLLGISYGAYIAGKLPTRE